MIMLTSSVTVVIQNPSHLYSRNLYLVCQSIAKTYRLISIVHWNRGLYATKYELWSNNLVVLSQGWKIFLVWRGRYLRTFNRMKWGPHPPSPTIQTWILLWVLRESGWLLPDRQTGRIIHQVILQKIAWKSRDIIVHCALPTLHVQLKVVCQRALQGFFQHASICSLIRKGEFPSHRAPSLVKI